MPSENLNDVTEDWTVHRKYQSNIFHCQGGAPVKVEFSGSVVNVIIAGISVAFYQNTNLNNSDTVP